MLAKIDEVVMRISLRSRNEKVNASTIAEKFGGGGHFYAAGMSIKGEVWRQEKEWLAELDRVYQMIQEEVVRMKV